MKNVGVMNVVHLANFYEHIYSRTWLNLESWKIQNNMLVFEQMKEVVGGRWGGDKSIILVTLYPWEKDKRVNVK